MHITFDCNLSCYFPKMLTPFVDLLLMFVFFFLSLKHVYIPLLFYSGVDYIDAPTLYMMGLHSGVDTTGLTMDGVSLHFSCMECSITMLVVLTWIII
jgi:hypothetical protein